jgi:hypothetical protein
MRPWIVWCVAGLLGFLVLSATPGQLTAQRVQHLWPGSRVRVSHADACCASPQIGAFVSLGADSLILRSQSGADSARIAIPRSAVKSFEHSLGERDYRRRGTGLGFLGGVATGIATLAYVTRGCENEECIGVLFIAPYFVGGGALIGLIAGNLIGRSVIREEWQSLPLRL